MPIPLTRFGKGAKHSIVVDCVFPSPPPHIFSSQLLWQPWLEWLVSCSYNLWQCCFSWSSSFCSEAFHTLAWKYLRENPCCKTWKCKRLNMPWGNSWSMAPQKISVRLAPAAFGGDSRTHPCIDFPPMLLPLNSQLLFPKITFFIQALISGISFWGESTLSHEFSQRNTDNLLDKK